MCFLRSKIFTFSKMLLASILKKKDKKMKEKQITERRKTIITFLCSKTLEVLKERLSSLTKVKMEAKGDKMMIS